MPRKSILIVDDEIRMADSLRDLLRSAGYAAESIHDGRGAIDWLADHECQVVVSDLRMPGVDGIELIQHIHRRHPHILVIVATAYASTESAIEAMHYQVFDYLRKPFGFEMLRLAVEKAFQHIETNQLREDTAAMISHDIKIPLTSIIGFAALLHDRETGRAHPRSAEFAETIEANGQKILELIDNYLTTCKFEAGKLLTCATPVNPRTMIEDLVSTAMFSANRCNCEIVRDLDRLPQVVHLDECLMYRAIGNLLHNAIKYNHGGRPVTIRGDVLAAAHSPLERETALLVVENHATGLRREELDGIFNRFRRGSLTRGIEGSGIGLYVVEAVVKAHDGRVGVELIEPDLVRFTLYLPTRFPAEAHEARTPEDAKRPGGPVRKPTPERL
jgi:signal transduction histidine kinase